jgi:glutamate-5-semialdehyde dehydrogenase
MAAGVREVAALADPLGRTLAVTELDEGLTLYKESCSIGVLGIVFEARPEIVPQIAALALKSGNAVILKGGSEAQHSNRTLMQIWKDVLANFPDIPSESVNLLYTRADVEEMLSLEDEIDLIIPRGSREFVRHVTERSRIPVLGNGEGICHVYVDSMADLEKALNIAFDSKVQYPAACNAMETLLVHEDVAGVFLPEMLSRFQTAGVQIRGCPRAIEFSKSSEVIPASEGDWVAEYSDLILAIKVVCGTDEAIEHINHYGSGHTESIVTEDAGAASHFMELVDAAGVYHNVSTRFADGFRYGFGAELGISTSKLHARGPVGLEGLTSYKYKLIGDGQTVASYVAGERTFKHRRIK